MQLTRDNVLWFAGLFEGEGCLTRTLSRNKNHYDWSMTLGMTDKDVITKIHDKFGGNFYIPSPHKNENYKQRYCWSTGKYIHIYALVVAIYQFMGIRRKEKIELFIEDFSTRYKKYKHKSRKRLVWTQEQKDRQSIKIKSIWEIKRREKINEASNF